MQGPLPEQRAMYMCERMFDAAASDTDLSTFEKVQRIQAALDNARGLIMETFLRDPNLSFLLAEQMGCFLEAHVGESRVLQNAFSRPQETAFLDRIQGRVNKLFYEYVPPIDEYILRE